METIHLAGETSGVAIQYGSLANAKLVLNLPKRGRLN